MRGGLCSEHCRAHKGTESAPPPCPSQKIRACVPSGGRGPAVQPHRLRLLERPVRDHLLQDSDGVRRLPGRARVLHPVAGHPGKAGERFSSAGRFFESSRLVRVGVGVLPP